jgi:hypothetical protein
MTKQPPKKTRGKNKGTTAKDPAALAAYATERAKGTTKKQAAEKLGISRRQLYHMETAAPDLLNKLITEAGELLAREGLPKAVTVTLDTLDETLDQGVTGTVQREIEVIDETTGEKTTKPLEIYDKDLHKGQLGLRKLGITAAQDVLKAVGILNTPAAAPVIGNLTINQSNVLLPAVRNVLQAVATAALEAGSDAESDKVTDLPLINDE